MEQLAEFEYEERIGAGQFGVVYRCRSRLTGDVLAVKHIHARSADLTEWQAEAEALAACHNDHIVRIRHAAATSEGPVLVMDFLPAGDAERRWLPSGGPVGDVIDCLIDATWGLHHMHAAGLLHRDLKPANLLFDRHGRAVIGDFGLAGQATKRAEFAYSPHIPPEVVAGGEWTPAADIYALGVTGWRLLGAPPVPSPLDLDEALRRGAWPNRDLWPMHIHSSARRVLGAAMHPNPARRPQSAAKLREQLAGARPLVNLREVGPSSWAGDDRGARYVVTRDLEPSGWRVRAARDAGSGYRRLRGDATFEDRSRADRFTRETLEALATGGPAAVRSPRSPSA